jgi:uncharacterized membrane protein
MSNHRVSRSRLAAAIGIFALALAGTAAAATAEPEALANVSATYSYQTVDYPGASLTIIWGLNDFGQISGEYQTGGAPPSHAWAYRDGHFETLDPDGLFGDRKAAAGGPNDLGTLYGAYADASTHEHGFMIPWWGQVETVDFPGHLNSNVDGINLFGAIAGVYWDADGAFHGMLRRYGRDTPIDVPGAHETYPLGIGNSGEIVGYWDDDPASTHGFYRGTNGRFSSIDVPLAGPGGTVAFSINDVGQITGYYTNPAGALHGFIEKNGKFTYVDVPGALYTIPTQINNFGVIAGQYFDTTGKRHGFVATPW